MAYEITLVTTMAISILFALSLNFITGFCGQISLGHAAFMGVGAYTSAVMMKAGFPFLLTIPLAAVFAGLLGVLVGLQNDRVCLLGRVLIRRFGLFVSLFLSLNAHGPRSMVFTHRWFDSFVVRRSQTVRRLTIELPSIGDGDRQHPQLLLRERRRWETKQGEGSI